eukprot:2049704-Rhodomonas_salina.1
MACATRWCSRTFLSRVAPSDGTRRWCMAEGDQDRSGYLQQGELFVVLNRYKKYTDDQPNMVRPATCDFLVLLARKAECLRVGRMT